MTPHSNTYIGFWKRTLASIIDAILLSFVLFPLLIGIYGWGYFDPNVKGFVAGPADLVISWIVPIFIIIGFWVWRQATPGKMVIHSKIVDATTGENPTIKQWIIRYIGYFVSFIPLCLGYIWIAFDKRKQGWHDKMAGTIVIHKSDQSKQVER